MGLNRLVMWNVIYILGVVKWVSIIKVPIGLFHKLDTEQEYKQS